MKIFFIVFLLSHSCFGTAQMTKSDSALAVDLWNEIDWTEDSKSYPYPWDYSNGNKFIELESDSLKRIVSGATYYFDGIIAMKSRLLSGFEELESNDPVNANFQQVNYYPDGTIRMLKINSARNKLTLYYSENQKIFHIDQITDGDTISGIFLTNFNEDFDLEFSVYESGVFLGKLLTDRNYNLILKKRFLLGEIAEEKRRVFIETLVKPYRYI